MTLSELIDKANAGEQNRYGEIEYVYSEHERISFFEQIIAQIRLHGIGEEETQKLKSLIYWNFCSSQSLAAATWQLVLNNYDLPSIKQSLLSNLENNYTSDFRLRFLQDCIQYSEKLPRQHFCQDVITIVQGWLEQEHWQVHRNELTDILQRFNQFLKN